MENMDERRSKLAVARMKAHATLWQEGIQNTEIRQGKDKIRLWSKILEALRAKFHPCLQYNYEQRNLKRQFQNAKVEKGMKNGH